MLFLRFSALTAAEQACFLPLLPPARRERLLSSPQKYWDGPLLAWALLAWALERKGVSPLPETAWEANGKPYFPGRPDICFSLSHTAGAVACALSDTEIGVDIEGPRSLSPRMLALLDASDEREALARWVRREAAAKARGVPHSLRQPMDGEEDCRVYSLSGGYLLAVSQPEEPEEVTLARLLAFGKTV